MPTTYKELLAAAHAAVPKVTPAEAAGLVEKSGALIVDVRDGTEVAASGKVKGAVAVPRGSLESRADPESPNHNPAFRKDHPVILYLRRRRTRRAGRQDAARPGIHGCPQPWRLQGLGRGRRPGRTGMR